MFDKLEILNMAQGMATHAAARQSVLARNIANADTPDYRARDLPSFKQTYEQGQPFTGRATRDGHIADGSNAAALHAHEVEELRDPNGNSVSLETEMMKAVETKRQHDLALTIYKTSLGILRSSIGR